jgi:hypothetical protein
MTAPHRIDVRHHILPREYVSALALLPRPCERVGGAGNG